MKFYYRGITIIIRQFEQLYTARIMLSSGAITTRPVLYQSTAMRDAELLIDKKLKENAQ